MLLCSFSLCAVLLFAGCANEPKLFRQVRPLMGTIVEITVCQAQEQKALIILQKAFEEIARVEDMMSCYKKESEISRINAEAFKAPVRVSDELFGLIQESIEYWRMTRGAFDVTVEPLMVLWPFYKDKIVLPAKSKVTETLKSVGADKLELDPEKKTVRFTHPRMALDLGAIAKGYAVDRAIQVIRAAGVRCALVNAGGDLYALGRKPAGRKWRMGVQHPRKPDRLICTFDIEDTGVATSGDYERYFIKDGKRYCHIIDPHTGVPATGSVSVTVEADNATRADALATSVFVLGPEEGIKLIEALPRVEGAIISRSPDGKARIAVSSGFNEVFKVDEKSINLPN